MQGFTKDIPIDNDGTLSSNSDFIVSSQKAVKTYVDLKEDNSNKKTTMTGNEASNSFFLSAKAVYDWAVGLFIQIGTAVNRKIYNYQNTDSSVTGSTSETVIANLAVVGGLMGVNGKLTIDSFIYALGTSGTKTFRLYVSTVGTNTVGSIGTPASSTLIGTNQLTATQLAGGFIRDLVNKNSESANNVYPATTSANSDLPAQTTARTTVNINTANNYWVVMTTQLANSGDTAGSDSIQLYIDKP